jgi:integrase
MAVYKRPDSRCHQYDLVVNGRRYRGTTKKQTLGAAKTFEANLRISLETTGFAPKVPKRQLTLLQYMPTFEKWFQASNQLKPNSKSYYRDGLVVLRRSQLAHILIASITEDDVDVAVFTDLEGKRSSAHQSNQALSTLRVMLNKAKKWGDIPSAPRVRLLQAEGRSAIVTHDIEDRLLNALQRPEKHRGNQRHRNDQVDIYLLMHDCGLRTCEALVARVENIDWLGKRLYIQGGKSKRAKRWVPLSDRVIQRLQSRCFNRKDGWIFPSERSKTGHMTSPWKGFRAARKKANIGSDIVLYSGRHTFGTFGMAQTGNIFAVSDSMGHADIKSMRPYQHHPTDALRDVINNRNESRHVLRHVEPRVQ